MKRATRDALEGGLKAISKELFQSYDTARKSNIAGQYYQHHVYVLDVADVDEGAPLDVAVQKKRTRGWRFLWTRAGCSPVMCDVGRVTKTAKPKLLGWAQGPGTVQRHQTLQDLDKRQAVKNAKQTHVLSIPALQVEALWVRAKSKADDKIVPIIAPRNWIEPLRVYAHKDFFKAAIQVATRRREALQREHGEF